MGETPVAEPEPSIAVPPCPICGGRGWVRHDVAPGHADFGKAFPCTCQQQASVDQRLARLRRFSNMGVLARVTFERTDAQGRGSTADARARFQAALDVARRYAESPDGWLTLSGASGTGKTHLAAAIANRCMERGLPVFFAFVPDLLDHLRASFNPENEVSYDDLFEQVKSIPVLVLDDLGMQSSTPWAEEKLFQVLNHRFVSGLPTIITTNLPVEQMDARLQSRLLDPQIGAALDLGRADSPTMPGIGAVPPALLRVMTFETFKLGLTDPAARRQLRAAFDFAVSYARHPEGWFVLLGNSGCGKTHLAVAVANERLRAGGDVFFAFVPDLLDHLRYTFSPDSRVTYDELFDRVRQTPLLILDDLGAQSSTPWAQEKLYQIIVHRHNARLATIVTTRGLPPNAGDPITSRLNDPGSGEVHPLDLVPDHRQSGGGRPRSAPPGPPPSPRPPYQGRGRS